MWDILAPPSVVKSTVVKTTVVAGLIGGGKKEDTVGEVGKERFVFFYLAHAWYFC